jgi:hypothetical protein
VLFASALFVVLGVLIFTFYKLKWDEKLMMLTSKYALRFNEERTKNHLPPLTYDFVKDGMNWDTKLDSVSDRKKFVLLRKTMEENDAHNAAELEYNLLAKALSDTTVMYLRIQYNYLTGNYYAETTTGNLNRPSFKINKLTVFEDCCSRSFKQMQVDSMLK